MVGVLGFEPRTSSLSGTRSNQLSYTPSKPLSDGVRMVFPPSTALVKVFGGAEGTRTLGILLAKQTLYQLSYGPIAFDC